MGIARLTASALFLVAGCSGVYVASTAGPDASSTADSSTTDATILDATLEADTSMPDGGDASSACDPRAPFTTIEPMDGLNSSGDEVGLALTDRGLTAYVVTAESVDGSYGRSIGVAKRASTSSSWGPVAKIPSLSSPGYVFDNPSLPADGRTLYLEATGPNSPDVIALPRNALGELDFASIRLVAGLSTMGAWEFDSYVTRDGRSVYFGSDRTGTSLVYRATLGPSGEATRVDALLGFAKNGTEASPVPFVDGTAIYFSRQLERVGGGKQAEIYASLRDPMSLEFGDGTPVSELAAPGTDYPVDISDDGCTLYFASDSRKPSLGKTDLYVAKRSRR
jgi:hypothetical protein